MNPPSKPQHSMALPLWAIALTCLFVATPTEAADSEEASDATPAAQTVAAAAEDSEVLAPPAKRSLWERLLGQPSLDPGYQLRFDLLRDISIPGPLPDGQPRLVGDTIEINVNGGVLRSDGQNAQPVEPRPPAPTMPDEPLAIAWGLDPAGRIRAGILPTGHLVLEKKCKRCRRGWRRQWKLKVPGTATTRPLVTESRVYFGAQDNRVYSLKKRNGHRIWASDLEERSSRPVVLWDGVVEVKDSRSAAAPRRQSVQVILVMPDRGSQLVALDARSGRKMTSYDLSIEEGRLLGIPLPLPDGSIVVAREHYSAKEASLMVFVLNSGGRGQGAASEQDDERENDRRSPASRPAGGSRTATSEQSVDRLP